MAAALLIDKTAEGTLQDVRGEACVGINIAGDGPIVFAIGRDVAAPGIVRVARARVARAARAITVITHGGGRYGRRVEMVWTNQEKDKQWERDVQSLATSDKKLQCSRPKRS